MIILLNLLLAGILLFTYCSLTVDPRSGDFIDRLGSVKRLRGFSNLSLGAVG